MADKPRIAEPRREIAQRGILETMKTQAMIDRFASYAPPGIDFKPLHASAVLAIAQQPLLQQAKPMTLVQAMMGVTRLGLAINTPEGHAYLIPFKMGQDVVIQVVIGYRGFLELAFRSGDLVTVGGDVATMEEWKEGLFKFQKGTDEFIHHTYPPSRVEGESDPAFAYAVAKLKDGAKFDVMPWAAITRIKTGSQGYSYAKSQGEASKAFLKNPWVAHEWQMGVKTVLRRMTKTMRLSAVMAQAVALDEMGEERDIDFDSVVDLDPHAWTDLSDASERQQEAKTGEQHQVRTPARSEPEKKGADPNQPAEKPAKDGAQQQASEEPPPNTGDQPAEKPKANGKAKPAPAEPAQQQAAADPKPATAKPTQAKVPEEPPPAEPSSYWD